MSQTQRRLDAYYAAEERILSAGLSVRLSERQRQEAELETIRKGIAALEAKLAMEHGKRSSVSSLRGRVVTFCD